MEPYKIAIDASIAIKWYLTDESDTEMAANMLIDYKEHRVNFIVPRLFYYEMINSVHIAVQRKRITENDGMEVLKDIFLIETTVVDSDELIKNAYLNARKYTISVSDALYLGIAKEHGTVLYTADRKFYNSMKGKKDSIRWIGDYKRVG